MNLKNKIFDIYKANFPEPGNSSTEDIQEKLFIHKDPFDFYRNVEKEKKYVPVTQRGLRKAFAFGIIGIEFFIEMATSLRPLADEAQDIDEIARLLSQQKLTTNPNLHSITILRNLIKDQNPEIALYAAEGLNTIENTFLEKILRIKKRIKEKRGRDHILHYLLGLLYLEFARLLHGQRLIQMFYLNEALTTLKKANDITKNNKRILSAVGDAYMLMRKNRKAIRVFTYLFSRQKKDLNVLMKLAECYYNEGDYQNVTTLAVLASKSAVELDEISNLIIYQWTLNI